MTSSVYILILWTLSVAILGQQASSEGTQCYSTDDYDKKMLQTLKRINEKVDAFDKEITKLQENYETAELFRDKTLQYDKDAVMDTLKEYRANLILLKKNISPNFELLMNRYGKRFLEPITYPDEIIFVLAFAINNTNT